MPLTLAIAVAPSPDTSVALRREIDRVLGDHGMGSGKRRVVSDTVLGLWARPSSGTALLGLPARAIEEFSDVLHRHRTGVACLAVSHLAGAFGHGSPDRVVELRALRRGD